MTSALRFISLDTETSGLSNADQLTSFHAVEFDIRTAALGRELSLEFDPGVLISPFATAKTGQTNATQAKYPRLTKAHCVSMAEFLAGAEVWIHNKSFDERFVDRGMVKFGLQPIGRIATLVCSVQRARQVGHKDSKLDALCDYYRIDRGSRVVHGARVDAELLAQVVCRLQRGVVLQQVAPPRAEPLAQPNARPVAPALPRKGSADFSAFLGQGVSVRDTPR